MKCVLVPRDEYEKLLKKSSPKKIIVEVQLGDMLVTQKVSADIVLNEPIFQKVRKILKEVLEKANEEYKKELEENNNKYYKEFTRRMTVKSRATNKLLELLKDINRYYTLPFWKNKEELRKEIGKKIEDTMNLLLVQNCICL